jgi:ParB family transcriptional regulator, chromosome partitioning protein
MMHRSAPSRIVTIPLDEIEIGNPRTRARARYRSMLVNIAQVGLKRPITVTRREGNGPKRYSLVCGQGRLEAFRDLGQTAIPAIVLEVGTEDAMVMSLVENIARRKHRGVDLLRDIAGLKERGYDEVDISVKTGLSVEYARGIAHLIEKGERQLLSAVEFGKIPLTVAINIAAAENAELQRVLQEAYDRKLLRGNRILTAQRIVTERQTGRKSSWAGPGTLSAKRLLEIYQAEAEKKHAEVRRAESVHGKLVFVVEALRALLAHAEFRTILAEEGLGTLPQNLAHRLAEAGT